MTGRALSALLTAGLFALALSLSVLQAAVIIRSAQAPLREPQAAALGPRFSPARSMKKGDSSKRDGKQPEDHRRPPPHQRGFLPGDLGPRVPRHAAA